MAEEFELASSRARDALNRAIGAWDAEHPDDPVYPATPPPSAWYPDPNLHPVATRQWAELTRMRASALRQEGFQVRAEAAQVFQSNQAVHAVLQRRPRDNDPAEFIRVGRAILRPPTGATPWITGGRL